MESFLKWWKETSWAVKIVFPFTLVITIGSAIKTWIEYDLWRPASIAFVKKEVKPIQPVLRDLQLDVDNGKILQKEGLYDN